MSHGHDHGRDRPLFFFQPLRYAGRHAIARVDAAARIVCQGGLRRKGSVGQRAGCGRSTRGPGAAWEDFKHEARSGVWGSAICSVRQWGDELRVKTEVGEGGRCRVRPARGGCFLAGAICLQMALVVVLATSAPAGAVQQRGTAT